MQGVANRSQGLFTTWQSLSGYVHTLYPRLQVKLTTLFFFFFKAFLSFFFFFSLVLNETKGPLGMRWAASSIAASQRIPARIAPSGFNSLQ